MIGDYNGPRCKATGHTVEAKILTVTMALSRVVFEIFNIEKFRDLEIGFRGDSKSLKVVPFDRLCMASH